MAYRKKQTKQRAKRTFRATANKTHKKNITSTRPKRGGYRL